MVWQNPGTVTVPFRLPLGPRAEALMAIDVEEPYLPPRDR